MTMAKTTIQHRFIPGDSWLYYKIYAGANTSEHILKSVIKPVSQQLVSEGICDQWFFIRYSDPKPHLRLRFHYTKSSNIAIIINKLKPYFTEFVAQDLIESVQIDTYQRELERYGSNTMTLSEALFYHDSKMIVDFIDMIEGHEGEELRWLFSLRAIDSLLNAFKLENKEKLKLMDTLKTGFRSEFDTSKALGKQLNNKYRTYRERIDAFMIYRRGENSEYIPLLDLLDTRDNAIEYIAESVLKCQKDQTLDVRFNDLLASYIHMHMNRLFKSRNRAHEMVCYDFLCRYYRSSMARSTN